MSKIKKKVREIPNQEKKNDKLNQVTAKANEDVSKEYRQESKQLVSSSGNTKKS